MFPCGHTASFKKDDYSTLIEGELNKLDHKFKVILNISEIVVLGQTIST